MTTKSKPTNRKGSKPKEKSVPTKVQENEQPKAATSQEVELSKIFTSELNPRRYFNEETLQELAESIRKVGVIQAINLRPKADNTYEIVCGERRYRAALIAELSTIPAVIKEYSDEQVLEIALIENMQRDDVRAMEEAQAIKLYLDKKDDVFALAAKLGKSVSFIKDRLKLNNLIEEFKPLVNNEEISIGIGIYLATYDTDVQREVYTKYFGEQASGYMDWRNIKYKEFVQKMYNLYNANLDNALFDTTECNNCPYNSAIQDLFVSEGSCKAQCLNKLCYAQKVKDNVVNSIVKCIEQNPTAVILKQHYVDAWLLDALKEKSIELESSNNRNWEYLPDEPEMPVKDDYIFEGEFDEEGYDVDMTNYREELEDYRAEMETINNGKERGELFDCILVNNSSYQLAYCYPEEVFEDYVEVEATETTEDEEPDTDTENDEVPDTEVKTSTPIKIKVDIDEEMRKIGDLKDKDKRNAELKVINTVEDVKTNIFGSDYDLSKFEEIPLEERMMYFYMLDSLTTKHTKQLFKGNTYARDEQKLEVIANLTDEQKLMIKRDYIVSKLKHHAYSHNSVHSKLLIEYSLQHFQEKTTSYIQKYEEVYQKRKVGIDSKISDIEKEIESKKEQARKDYEEAQAENGLPTVESETEADAPVSDTSNLPDTEEESTTTEELTQESSEQVQEEQQQEEDNYLPAVIESNADTPVSEEESTATEEAEQTENAESDIIENSQEAIEE